MLDAHCHLDDPRLVDDAARVVRAARDAGVTGCVVAAWGPWRFAAMDQLVCDHPDFVRVTRGLHPWALAEVDAHGGLDDALAAIEDALDDPRVVGIGECGLDRSERADDVPWALQCRALEAQLELAARRELPVVLHVVRAHNEMMALLREHALPAGGLVHAFRSSPEIAAQYVELGFHVSIGGAIVGSNSDKLRRAVAELPDARLLIETDAPDQTPSTRRPADNEPAFLVDVAAAVAELREVSVDAIASLTERNTRDLFGL